MIFFCLWRALGWRGADASPDATHRWAGAHMDASNLRVSDDDRDRVVEVLSRHRADGRLDAEEFERRLDTTLRARTRADLEVNLTDLPALDRPRPVDRLSWWLVAPLAALLLLGLGAAAIYSGGRALFGLWWVAVLAVVAARHRLGRRSRHWRRPDPLSATQA